MTTDTVARKYLTENGHISCSIKSNKKKIVWNSTVSTFIQFIRLSIHICLLFDLFRLENAVPFISIHQRAYYIVDKIIEQNKKLKNWKNH